MSAGGSALPAAAKKARLLGAFLSGGPVHCTWQLSARCESFCHFCDHRAESALEELDAAGCAHVAGELARHGSLLVSFTGSEPFLRSDLPAVIRAVAKRHFPLLVTNGWLVSAPAARAVWEAGLEVATVALEDAQADRHDAITGQPGSHARAVKALEALSASRTRATQRINLRTRLRSADVGHVPALLELAAPHAATVTVEPAFPLPALDGALDAVLDRLGEMHRLHPRLRIGGRGLADLGRALRGGVPGCLAGRAFFNVNHRGEVSKCLEFQGPGDRVATLPQDGAKALGPRLRAAHAANDCRACWYASRAEVEALYTVRGFLGGLTALVRA